MAWSWNRKNLAVAVCGVAATVVFGVQACLDSGEDEGAGNSQSQHGGTNNKQAQGGGQAADVINNANIFQQGARDLTREEALQQAGKYADVPPPAGDIAPYLVVAPGHLFVRTSPDTDGRRVGAAWDKTLVYAGCTTTTDFDPVLDDEVPAVWIKIHWPRLDPGDDMRSSQPSDPLQGWVYAGRLVPAGHNGRIRTC
ncbi:hypothetical protein [Micromonospora sp. WMMD987]|uniref:hypothetical protein n=1 Tax=Micromonospora TaxID=1873 RepID=UPI00249AEE1E|nr:hypothetical protein [Micromonospora sp. WMMD987]WFE92935.1 hypothetical protein O7612_16050 [Micromonospora sp. WMMD987]